MDDNQSDHLQSGNDLAKCRSRSKRRKYKKVSEEDRLRILNCFESGRNWRKLGKSLGINYSTLRSVIHRGIDEVRGRYVGRKVDHLMLAKLESFISEDDTISVSEMTNRLIIEMPDKHPVHRVTVGRSLDGMLYFTKTAKSFQKEDLQSFDIFQRRKEYARWFLHYADCNTGNTFFVDKINFNIWCLNINKRRQATASSDDNVSILDRTILTIQLILAINGKLGLVGSDINDGVNPFQRLNQFFDSFLANFLKDDSNNETIIILDSAVMPDCDVARWQQMGVKVKFLRPGCSDFNPIQPCITKLKQDVKLDLSLRQIEFLTNSRYGLHYTQHRRNMLESVLRKHLRAITDLEYLQYYHQMYETILTTSKDELHSFHD